MQTFVVERAALVGCSVVVKIVRKSYKKFTLLLSVYLQTSKPPIASRGTLQTTKTATIPLQIFARWKSPARLRDRLTIMLRLTIELRLTIMLR